MTSTLIPPPEIFNKAHKLCSQTSLRKVIAGIVLYNPDIERLRENIAAIVGQVDRLVLVDNGCSSSDYETLADDERIVVIKHGKNLGIATALNTIVRFAAENGYQWALTLDQDSVAPSNLIEAYKSVIPGKERLGMVCCKIHDRNFIMQREERLPQKDRYVEKCITSASMVNVEAWQDVGGFDDQMFIDSVDFDFCLMLRKRGWKIFRTYKAILLHELGKTEVIRIFGKEYTCSHYPPFRHYYIARNLIYEGRKHNMLMKDLRVFARHVYTTWRYESQKWEKSKCILKGFFDGWRMTIKR